MHMKSLIIWAPALLISVHQERIMVCMRIPVAKNNANLQGCFERSLCNYKSTPELTDKEVGFWPAS